MKEIKLTKRYPQSRTEDIVDAYMRGWIDALDAVQNGKFHIAEQTEPNCSEKPNNSTGYNLSPVVDEPQTEDLQDWKDRMWAEAVEASKTEPSGYNLLPVEDEPQTVETMSCAECKHRPIGAEICEEPCHYEPKDETQTERSE